MTLADRVAENAHQHLGVGELVGTRSQCRLRPLGSLRPSPPIDVGHAREDAAGRNAAPEPALEPERVLNDVMRDVVRQREGAVMALEAKPHAVVAGDRALVAALRIEALHTQLHAMFLAAALD